MISVKAKAKRLDSITPTSLYARWIDAVQRAIILPILLFQNLSIHGTKLDKKLYRIAFLV